jgi:kynurenine formamidase
MGTPEGCELAQLRVAAKGSGRNTAAARFLARMARIVERDSVTRPREPFRRERARRSRPHDRHVHAATLARAADRFEEQAARTAGEGDFGVERSAAEAVASRPERRSSAGLSVAHASGKEDAMETGFVTARRARRSPRFAPGARVVGRTALLLLGLAGCQPAGPSLSGRLVDLTHPFDADTVYWPTSPEFELEPIAAGFTQEGYYYAANRFHAAEHGGTHLDAPVHFFFDGRRVAEIPLQQLVATGVVIDVSRACAEDRDYRVQVEDLSAWEERHGRIPKGAIVLLHTGFGRFWPDRERYLGTAERGPAAVPELHFPGLAPEAARWLVAEREIGAIGLDTASIDHGPSQNFEAHQVLCESQIPVLENLAKLDRLPPSGFLVVALPMSIREGTGAPLRAIAVLP